MIRKIVNKTFDVIENTFDTVTNSLKELLVLEPIEIIKKEPKKKIDTSFTDIKEEAKCSIIELQRYLKNNKSSINVSYLLGMLNKRGYIDLSNYKSTKLNRDTYLELHNIKSFKSNGGTYTLKDIHKLKKALYTLLKKD